MQYFSFDAETDGLYGEVFAIGAVVMDEKGGEIETFSGMAQVDLVKSSWVKENVLPSLLGMPEYASRDEMREAFWQFLLKYREKAVIIADVPYPVEAELLRNCVERKTEQRWQQGPYPLIDVASVLFAKGIDPLIDRISYVGLNNMRHQPLDDARVSALALIKAMKE